MKHVKSNLIFLLFMISAGINAYLYKSNNNLKETIYSSIKMYNECIVEKQDAEFETNLRDSLLYLSENTKVSEKIKVIGNDNEEINLSDIINSPRIVIYFDEYTCMSCYSNTFNAFNDIMSLYDTSSFIFLGNFQNPIEFKAFLKAQKISCLSYNLNGEKIGIPIENIGSPFMFIVEPSLKVHSIIVINRKFAKRYEQFLLRLTESLLQ